jgi:hypothetical protein
MHLSAALLSLDQTNLPSISSNAPLPVTPDKDQSPSAAFSCFAPKTIPIVYRTMRRGTDTNRRRISEVIAELEDLRVEIRILESELIKICEAQGDQVGNHLLST